MGLKRGHIHIFHSLGLSRLTNIYARAAAMADPLHRPRVFLDVQSGPEHFGRIVIELFDDKAPKTSEKYYNPTLTLSFPSH